MAQGVGSILGGPAAAFLKQATGSWTAVFVVVALLDALTALLAITALRRMRQGHLAAQLRNIKGLATGLFRLGSGVCHFEALDRFDRQFPLLDVAGVVLRLANVLMPGDCHYLVCRAPCFSKRCGSIAAKAMSGELAGPQSCRCFSDHVGQAMSGVAIAVACGQDGVG
jgi:hypothetical protein